MLDAFPSTEWLSALDAECADERVSFRQRERHSVSPKLDGRRSPPSVAGEPCALLLGHPTEHMFGGASAVY
jgi:hypothetical protein